MTSQILRAWWFHRQGLDGSLAGASAGEVLSRAGWARSVGGSCPYTTLFARAGIGKDAAEKAHASMEIYELSSARGCTYVLPASDFALGLKLGQSAEAGRLKTAMKLGVTAKEIDKLAAKILDALDGAVLDPDEIKKAVGGAVRNLGEEGKKKGLTTTLPTALGQLQSTGEIRRVPVNGRLDTQRFAYARWARNPLDKFQLAEAECYIELARRYFRWIGPATMAEFQWFSGLGVKAAKDAVAPLGLVAMESGGERLMFPADLESLRKFKNPPKPTHALVSSIDSMVLLRRDFRTLLAPGDEDRKVAAERGLVSLGGVADLPSHPILAGGRIAGLWEFDPDNGTIAWAAFGKKDKAMEKAVLETERYVRGELGDVRSFSLDSAKSRAPRIEALRRMGG